MSDASNIKLSAIERAVRLLNASGAQYRVIFEDRTFGDLEVAEKKTRPYKKGRKSYKHMYKDAMDNLQVGDSFQITCDKETAEPLRSAITSYIYPRWGKGNFMTAVDKTPDGEGAVISILRV